MFEWLTNLIDLAISFVPRFTLIRATHLGVKWPRGGSPVELAPGLRWYWPLVTDVEVIVAARQTNLLNPQSVTLKDGTPWVVRGVCVFSIYDVVAAIGQQNWDVDSTVDDLCQAAILKVITRQDKSTIRNIGSLNHELTEEARKALRMYGVRVRSCGLVESAQARSIRLLGEPPPSVEI